MSLLVNKKTLHDYTKDELSRMSSEERKALRQETRKQYREKGYYKHARRMTTEKPLIKTDKADYVLGKSMGIY